MWIEVKAHDEIHSPCAWSRMYLLAVDVRIKSVHEADEMRTRAKA